MGGADKGINCIDLVETIAEHVKKVILIPGTGSNKIVKLFKVRDDIPYFEVGTLEDAVAQASAAGSKGDTILFSPAFASFGMFKNEYERNDVFVDIVTTL
jgi:UDP-N-acetylmuramoylalanine--D-glutamate ligase